MGLEGVRGVDLDARIAAVVRIEAVLGGHAEVEVTVFGGDTERGVVRIVQHFERIAVQRMNFRVADLRNNREVQRRDELHAGNFELTVKGNAHRHFENIKRFAVHFTVVVHVDLGITDAGVRNDVKGIRFVGLPVGTETNRNDGRVDRFGDGSARNRALNVVVKRQIGDVGRTIIFSVMSFEA